MHLQLLALLTIFIGSSGASISSKEAMKIAEKFQEELDNAIHEHTSHKLPIITDDFVYEDCVKYGSPKYEQARFLWIFYKFAPARGVLEARVDKDHLIYKVSYGGDGNVEMTLIAQEDGSWKLEKALMYEC
ncbi:hypothetical protein CAEBREN_15856 [Caenorhabditis brenneri]|uniref:DUF3828 domain-containing protein n=1 Tax=Caenorhabditis brenneri TaxID=135651 RepID=G0MM86_CAEBE|nr:hypothetical protein CAEBREN_15856 [Caenorhabditis brenneri]